MVNIGNMMKQAQQLQKKMADAQEKLNDIEVEGVSGGGVVKVTATAKGEIKIRSKKEIKIVIKVEQCVLEHTKLF